MLHGAGTVHITYEWKQSGGKVWKHGGKWDGVVPDLLAQLKKTNGGPRRMQLEKYILCRLFSCGAVTENARPRRGRR